MISAHKLKLSTIPFPTYISIRFHNNCNYFYYYSISSGFRAFLRTVALGAEGLWTYFYCENLVFMSYAITRASPTRKPFEILITTDAAGRIKVNIALFKFN